MWAAHPYPDARRSLARGGGGVKRDGKEKQRQASHNGGGVLPLVK